MRFSIRAIGKIKEKWMREGIEEYSKRLKPVAKVDVLESDEEKMPENPSAAVKGKVLEKEGEKLLRSIQDSGCVVLLDINGKKVSSEELAAWIAQKTIMGTSHFYFIIGSPYGNGKNIQARADLKLSMGPMTFTHQMARLILFEQLYRAVKINHHEPYHL